MDAHYNPQSANFYFFDQTTNKQLNPIFTEVPKAQTKMETPNKS